MKKPTSPRRARFSPDNDVSRIRRSRIEAPGPAQAARRGVTRSRTAPSRESTPLPASATATDPTPPVSTIALSGKRGSPALLELLGHKPSCAKLSKAGLVVSCDCKRSQMHDPAIAIGVVMHYARLALSQRATLPTLIVELLTHHVEAGDPACILVAEWLDQSGLLGLPITSVRGQRIRS